MKRIKARKPESYVKRTYRTLVEQDLVSSFVKIKDTDLHIQADQEVSAWAFELALQYRLQIEKYIEQRPEFLPALSPLASDILAPPIVKEMLTAGYMADVGPMAAVAGAIAEYVGKALDAKGVPRGNGGKWWRYLSQPDSRLYGGNLCRSIAAQFAGRNQIAGVDDAGRCLHLFRHGWAFFKLWPGRCRGCDCPFYCSCRCGSNPPGQ